MKFTVLSKEALNPTVSRMVLSAPLIAAKAKAGQFIILRARSESERIPLTIADYDREKGTITIIYQIVGGATMEPLLPANPLPIWPARWVNPVNWKGSTRSR